MTEQPPSMRILYLEDNPVDADLARRALARLAPDYLLTVATSLAGARELLAAADAAYDLALLDLRLPDGSGLDFLGEIRARRLPLAAVVLTGSGSRDSAIAALKAGADNYLVKSGDYLERLPGVLAAALAQFKSSGIGLNRSLRVLYASRDLAEIEVMRRHLGKHAPQVELATVDWGAEVMARLKEREAAAPPCDVLLLDFQLPDIDALEIVKQLREEVRGCPPVVLLADQGSEEEVAEAMRLGVADYLIKQPGYLYGLSATLEQVARLAQLQREHETLRASERRYRQLEERFRVIFEGAQDGILVADPEKRQFVLGNPAICLMLGYTPGEITRLWVDDIHPAAELARVKAIIMKNLKGEAMMSRDIPVLRRDGAVFYADISAAFIHLDGRPYLMGIFRDVSERKEFEERLRLQVTAFNSSRDGMMITNLKPEIIAVNPAFISITGYAEEEVLGANPRILNSGRHDRAFFQSMWAHLTKHGHWQGEIWNRRKNGEVFPELLSISTVYDDQGQPSHYVGVKTDLTRLRHYEEKLEYLAHHDPLTGLPNRLLLEARLAHGLERARRDGGKLAVLLLDLDRFRTINDSLGHAVGDELLVAVVKRLRRQLRAEDTMARLAGDEFALVMESLKHYQEAEIMASRVHKALARPFVLPDGQEVYLQASIGISVFPQDGESGSALLSGADMAADQAKSAGGGQFAYVNPRLNEQARRLLELETALRKAIVEQEFVLYYQPKVDLRTGRVSGAEALVRWQRPGQGLVEPEEFIPVAERSGMIAELGAWVINEACRQMGLWREGVMRQMDLAVNVSARQFASADLPLVVGEALRKHGIKPQRLTLELTESMLMDKPEQTIARMRALKELGVKLSLDDFGTGYSSFSNLSRFPIDQLKIDRSFIREIVTSPDAATIAVSIIAMAQRIGLTVVAEGVETEAQCGYLRQNGCLEIQGFLFCKPLPAEEFAAFVRRGRTMALPAEADESRTLLIVDDEPNILKALQRLLQEEGYRVLTAGDAAAGLELLASNRVQVIISDQRMPGMRGIEFLRRARDLYPDTVRIILSGYADLETVVEAVNEGALYKFLTKPWQDDLLLQQIREAFLYFDALVNSRRPPAPGPCRGASPSPTQARRGAGERSTN
jgi:diguanylate cyclase (GGDEF)-like protein/PAS domain S-box-containing protein